MVTYLLLWIPMIVIAIVNGAIRELIIKKWVNDRTAHQLSTLTLILLFALYIGFVIKRFPPSSSSQSVFIGMIWLLLTLVFEFGLGLWRGQSWSTLLEDYNLLKGRLWLFIPLWVGLAPVLFFNLFK